jgi:hypothetical protein
MGPLVQKHRSLLGLLVVLGAVASGAAACEGSGGPEEVTVEKRFPLPADADLVTRLRPDAARDEVRRLTTDLAQRGGVEAVEAHYDTGEIRALLSRDMAPEYRRRLRARLLASPAVEDVELRSPE